MYLNVSEYTILNVYFMSTNLSVYSYSEEYVLSTQSVSLGVHVKEKRGGRSTLIKMLKESTQN